MTVCTTTPPRLGRESSTAHLTATLCGALRVSSATASIGAAQLGGSKARQILIALLLRPGQPVSKNHLIQILWDGAPPTGAVRTLETYVSALRKRLDTLAPGRVAITTVPGGYLVDPRAVDVDVHRSRVLLEEAAAPALPRDAALTAFAAGLAAARGALLPDEGAAVWLEQERVAHEDRMTRALAAAASAALAAGQHERAERWARDALERDQFDESAWRVLLESLELRGLHADGVRAYDRCRRLFETELGCAPGPNIRATFGRLLTGTREVGDEGVGALVDAVVRLHEVTAQAAALALAAAARPDGERAGTLPADRGGGIALSRLGAIEDACHLLENLLTTVRVRASFGTAISA